MILVEGVGAVGIGAASCGRCQSRRGQSRHRCRGRQNRHHQSVRRPRRKSRRGSPRREPATTATEAAAAEAAAPVETAAAEAAPATAERDGGLVRDRAHAAIAAPASSDQANLFPFTNCLFIDFLPSATWQPRPSRTGSSRVPGGKSGVNTGSAMRGAKSQSLKTAVNCGCAGLRLIGDDQLARCRLRPVLDPDLPVDVLLDEGKGAASSCRSRRSDPDRNRIGYSRARSCRDRYRESRRAAGRNPISGRNSSSMRRSRAAPPRSHRTASQGRRA